MKTDFARTSGFVRRVQETAVLLREVFGQEHVSVAHSRFLAPDRIVNDEALRERFGPPDLVDRSGTVRPQRHLVVASQVAEQSLDIDFDLMVTDLAPIDLVLQEHNLELGTAVVGAAGDADAGARALGYLAGDLAQAAGGDSAGPRSRAQELAFAALDRPFRAWLAVLGSRTSPLEARRAWQLAARRLFEQLGDELIEQSGPAAWVGRQVGDRHISTPEADIKFRRALDKAFELTALERKSKGKESVPA